MLNTIIHTKKKELEQFAYPEQIGKTFKYSLKDALLSPHRDIGVIAEVKKASPSKGMFKEHIDPAYIAKRYEASGADAVSVLTDRVFFKGDREYVKTIKQAVKIPVLRKDFIIDERQIKESALIGADAILLIAAALSPKRLFALYNQAKEMGLECLVEVHNRDELERLLDVFQPDILGINNRNLETFKTTIDITMNLIPYMPEGCVIVSESGYREKSDIDRIRGNKVNGILVGEALMTARTPEEGFMTLFGGKSL